MESNGHPRTHSPFTTFGALKALFARMRPLMPLKFVGPGESFAAEHPLASEWSFT